MPGMSSGPRWPWPSWLAGLLLGIAPGRVVSSPKDDFDDFDDFDDSAALVIEKSWDIIAVNVDIVDVVAARRTNKLYTTAAPLWADRNRLFARKASSVCPAGHSACASSLSGGCCPSGFLCEVADCVETAPSTATNSLSCGKAGYTGCGVSVGGGCCRSGYVCGRESCTAPSSVAQSMQCPASYYLCPSSYDYGCCATSMGCARYGCYSTDPTTLVYTATFTTTTDATGRGHVTTVTSTTVETPSPPTDTANKVSSGSSGTAPTTIFAKLDPTTTAKVDFITASGTADGGGGGGSSGLSPGAIGGLIGGLVALLVAVAVAAYFIVRNLRRTSREVKEAKRLSDASHTRSKTGSGSASKPRGLLPRPSPSVINRMEVDDLWEGGDQTLADAAGTQSSSGIGHAYHRLSAAMRISNSNSKNNNNNNTDSSAVSPALPAVPASPASPEPRQPGLAGRPGRPRSLSRASDETDAGATDGTSSVASYFDIPQRTHNQPGHRYFGSDPRISMESPVAAVADMAEMAEMGEMPGVATIRSRPRIVSDVSHISHASHASEQSTATPPVGSPLQPAELGNDGEVLPELDVVEPVVSPVASTMNMNIMARPRPFSNISAISGLSFAGPSPLLPPQQQQQHQQQQQQPQQPQDPPALDAIEEHLHGHYGPAHELAGQTRAGDVADQD